MTMTTAIGEAMHGKTMLGDAIPVPIEATAA